MRYATEMNQNKYTDSVYEIACAHLSSRATKTDNNCVLSEAERALTAEYFVCIYIKAELQNSNNINVSVALASTISIRYLYILWLGTLVVVSLDAHRRRNKNTVSSTKIFFFSFGIQVPGIITEIRA